MDENYMKGNQKYRINIILLLTVIIFSGCNIRRAGIEFSLSHNEEPVITVRSIDTKKYDLVFDTGWGPHPFLYDQGIEKLMGSKEKVQHKLFRCVQRVDPNLSLSTENIIKIFDKYTYSRILLAKFLNYNKYVMKKIYYNPQRMSEYAHSSNDGIVGIDYFGELKNITIDYVNEQIYLNHKELDGTYCDMFEMDIPSCYGINIIIDGVEEIAEIDTGCNAFIISQNFIEQNVSQNIKEEEIDYNFKKIEICNIDYLDITAYLSSDPRNTTSEESKNRTKDISLLGYTFFKNRIIQLDFENMKFCIQ
jgi:hypothetical protein